MKTIKFESNYGNFAYRMTAEIGEEVNAATEQLCLQGLANICYRVAGSHVDKALGVKERKGVEYSENDAEKINAAVSTKLTEMLMKDATKGLAPLKMSFAVTGQHVFGESASGDPTKADKELWTQVQALPAERFAKALVQLGIPEDYTDETALPLVRKFRLAEERAALEAAKTARLGKLG